MLFYVVVDRDAKNAIFSNVAIVSTIGAAIDEPGPVHCDEPEYGENWKQGSGDDNFLVFHVDSTDRKITRS